MGRKRVGKTFFIPASGYRLYDSQSVSVSSLGLCWPAAPYNATNGYCLNFRSSSAYPQVNGIRANGFPVRPVQE